MDEGNFIRKYHKAMVLANKDQLDKVKARVASDWVKDWAAELGEPVSDVDEFARKLEQFLSEGLGFAGEVKVSVDGDVLSIDVSQCALCPANEQLRQAAGEPTLCPILSTGLIAISRVLGKNATLMGVDKEGKQVGYCTIRYKLTSKN